MGARCTGLQLVESQVNGATFSGRVLRAAIIQDAVVDGGNWANVDAAEAALVRVVVRRVRLTGAVRRQQGFRTPASSSAVSISPQCDSLNWTRSGSRTVGWKKWTLRGDAQFRRLRVVTSHGPHWRRATFERCEMRDCELSGIGGADRLRGSPCRGVTSSDSAAVLAAGVGVHILDEWLARLNNAERATPPEIPSPLR